MKTFLKIIFLICFILEIQVNVNAQSVIWRQIIGEQYNEIGYNCIELRDGGYLMAGFKEILVPGTSFIIPKSYVVRLDHYGNILWEKIFGDSISSNSSVTLIEDPFGNIYLPYYAGHAHLIKLNSKGEILWNKDYPSDIEIFLGIEFIDNYKNLILLSQNLLKQFRTASVTKLDTSGNLIWNKVYYDTLSPLGIYHLGSNSSYWFTNQQYYICGFVSPSPGVENRVGLIIKLDTNGNVIWNKKYLQCKGIYSIAQNTLNTFIACGQADVDGYLYCQKFDSGGNITWSRNYRSDSLSYCVGYNKIIKTFDNNFALGTISGLNYGGLLIIDSLGNINTSKFYYYPTNFYINQNNINSTIDSGYIVSGSLDSNNTADLFKESNDLSTNGLKGIDALIFKIDKYGNTVSIRNNLVSTVDNFKLEIYPNPYNLSFKLNFFITATSDVKIFLYDISGKIVKKIENSILNQGNYQLNVNTPELSSAVYFLKMDINNNFYSRKILLIK